jgi:hypothetical protein
MRLLALKAKGLVLPSIHDSIVKAFRSLGVEVQDTPVPELPEEFQLFRASFSGNYQAIFTLDLGAAPNFISMVGDLQRWLRIPWIIWFIDDPAGYRFPEFCEPDYTVPFCWDQRIVEQINWCSTWKGPPMRHLPLATDPSVFYPVQKDFALIYPGGVFVGSTAHPNQLLDDVARTTPGFHDEIEKTWKKYREDFRQSMHALAWMHLVEKTGRPLRLIQKDPLGQIWTQALLHQVGIKKRSEIVSQGIHSGGTVLGDEVWRDILGENIYGGKIVYGDPLREIYSRSAFVLDVRQPQSRTGLTQRIFDASACGTAVLTEWSPEMESLFDPEREVFCFHNLESALQRRELILQDPQVAREKGKRALERIRSQHTYRHRAQAILYGFKGF